MVVEAPISKFKKNNLKIYIVFCIAIAVWCAYDGYFNDSWIAKHTDENGNPKPYLVFNRKAPPLLIGVAVLLFVYHLTIRNRKIIADEDELILSKKEKISYDLIQKIDKTHFKKKGCFVITYKNQEGKEVNQKLSNRTYDNLEAILDKLVAKIS